MEQLGNYTQEIKNMTTVKHIDEDWIGYVSDESWNSNLEYLLVSGDFVIRGRKVDGRLIAREKLEFIVNETLLVDRGFIKHEEVDDTRPSVLVQHTNGSTGYVYFEDWSSDQDALFVRDIPENWITTDDMVPHELTVDRQGTKVSGFLIERTKLKELSQ
jgi:hypothetical protein